MLLTDHFVFIHIPKTAGMFIKTICLRYGPPEWHMQDFQGPYGDHSTREHIPPSHRDKPLVSAIRNPWDWYVSWFFYHQVTGATDFFNLITDHGKRDFKDSINALLDLDLVEHFSSLYQAKVQGTAGLYGETAKLLLGNELQADFCRFENLREDFLECLCRYTEIPLVLREQIVAHKKINTNAQGDYRQYYDDALVERIQQRESQIIRRFGYVFES